MLAFQWRQRARTEPGRWSLVSRVFVPSVVGSDALSKRSPAEPSMAFRGDLRSAWLPLVPNTHYVRDKLAVVGQPLADQSA